MNTKHAWPRIGRIQGCLAAVVLLYGAQSMAAQATPTVAVRTATPQYGMISQPVQAYGAIGTAPGATMAVNLPYTAKLVRFRIQAGQSVTRGTPLFEVQADPAAVLATRQAATALKLAQSDLSHAQALYDQSLATQSQLDAARKAALDAKAAFDAQQVLGVGGGRVTVTASTDGVVTQIAAAQGDQVQAGATILQLTLHAASLQDVPNVALGVDPAAAGLIRVGDPIAVSGLSPALGNAAVQGRVAVVGAAIDPQSQLVDIGAVVPVAGTALLPGMHVKGEISTQSGRHWIIPRSAVLRDDQGAYVYQVGKDGHAHRIGVRENIENDDAYGVDGALDAAQPLVVSGNYELHDGDAVRVQAGVATNEQKDAAQ